MILCNICDIVYMGSICPLCGAEDTIKDLKDQIKELNRELDALKEK